jgi:hypothetical protein
MIFLPLRFRTTMGDASAPLPQMEGIATNSTPGACSILHSLASSMIVPPPITIKVFIELGTGQRAGMIGNGKMFCAIARTLGVTQIAVVFGFNPNTSSIVKMRCSFTEWDAFAFQYSDNILYSGDSHGFLRCQVVVECLLHSDSHGDYSQGVPGQNLFAFEVETEIRLRQDENVHQQKFKLISIAH